MYTVRLSELEMPEAGYENDPTMRVKADFPFSAATGTKNTAVVYFEVEPGHRLGTHTDSAEEILLILQGEAEATEGMSRVESLRERWLSSRLWCRTPCAMWATKRFEWSGSSPVRR